MSESEQVPRRRDPFYEVWLGRVAIGAVAAGVLFMTFYFGGLYIGFDQFLNEFPRRHLEATAAIEEIYGDHERTGEWLPEEALQGTLDRLAPGWRAVYAGKDPVIISAPGGYHGAVAYYFVPPKDGVISRDWVFSSEGSKRFFKGNVEYTPR